MVARITSTHQMTANSTDLTAGDIRLFLEGVSDNTKVHVTVSNGDQREPSTVTHSANINLESLRSGPYDGR